METYAQIASQSPLPRIGATYKFFPSFCAINKVVVIVEKFSSVKELKI